MSAEGLESSLASSPSLNRTLLRGAVSSKET